MTAVTMSYLQEWCIDHLSRVLEVPRSKVDPSSEFSNLGLDSVTAVTMVLELETVLGIQLDPEMLFDYPTITSLAEQLVVMTAEHPIADRAVAGVAG